MNNAAFGNCTCALIDTTAGAVIDCRNTPFSYFHLVAMDVDLSLTDIAFNHEVSVLTPAETLALFGTATPPLAVTVTVAAQGQLPGLRSCAISAVAGKALILFFR